MNSIVVLVGFAAAMGVDQGLKALVRRRARTPPATVPAAVAMAYTVHPGSASGFAGVRRPAPASGMVLLVAAFVLAVLLARSGSALPAVALAVAAGGAASNHADYRRQRLVINSLVLRGGLAFNLADVAISVGVGLTLAVALGRLLGIA